jgi:hypothetical protein
MKRLRLIILATALIGVSVGAFAWATAGFPAITAEADDEGKPIVCDDSDDPPMITAPGTQQLWLLTEDCKMILLEEKEFTPDMAKKVRQEHGVPDDSTRSGEQGMDSLFACKDWTGGYVYYQNNNTKTQNWTFGSFCYDGSQVTWWAFPPQNNPGAVSPWSYITSQAGDGWSTYPTISFVWYRNYFQSSSSSHWLQVAAYQYYDGYSPCQFNRGGTFFATATFSTYCG